MLRQLYPILLSIAVAMAIGVYLNPGEARVWIRQASHWGVGVLSDTLHTASALADETRSATSPSGYAPTSSGYQTSGTYPAVSQTPNWSYTGGTAGTTLGAPTAPPSAYAASTSPSVPASQATPQTTPPTNVFPRVLATGSSPTGISSSPQRYTPYPSTGGVPTGVDENSPYASTRRHPLRPSMEKEAPWATAAARAAGSQTEAAYSGSQQAAGIGSASPRVEWSGEWGNQQGASAAVKPPVSQYGRQPSPNVNSTVGVVAPNPVRTQASPRPASGSQYQLGPLPPVQPGMSQARVPSASQSAVASSVVPYGSVPSPHAMAPAGSTVPYRPPVASHAQTPNYPMVASVPSQPSHSASGIQGASIPVGAQMESPDPVADLTLCEGAQILARVGSEVVLGSEVLPMANQTLAGIEGIEKASEKDLALARKQLVKKILPQHIELKLLYVDAKRNLPPEAIEGIRDQLGKRFEEVEISERLKKLKLNSRRELEAKLTEWGTSIEHEKQAFIERAIAQQWVFEKIKKEDEVTHEELLDYYREHATEYDHPTRIRWEHLEVTFAKHPNKREAWQLMATMGNAVQQGQPLTQVAKERSEGVMASRGGQRDWLTQGSLRSDVLDRTLFSLPPGTLSPILEDETGFHIVRVVEREDAYRTPFEEIQGDIRDKIKNDRKEKRLQDFITKLREEIPVTTVFDEEAGNSVARGTKPERQF